MRQEPLLLIALLRPDKDALSWPIIERVQADLADLFSKITLAPLSLDQTQELLAQMLPGLDLPDSVRTLVWHKAEGNPFFVEEVLRSLIDAQSIVRDGEQWRLSGEPNPLSIPNTLTALLAARIDRLPADAKQVAQVAAVIGRTFTYPLLEAACTAESLGGGQASLRTVLEQLSLVDLLHVSGHEPEMQYQFKHALTQEAAYNSLLIKRRKALHRRPCAALEQLSAQVRVALEMRDGMRRGFGAE